MKSIFGQSIWITIFCLALNGTASANAVDEAQLPLEKEVGTTVLLLTGKFDGQGKIPATLTTAKETLFGLGLGQAGDESIDAADAACVISFSSERGFKVGEWTLPFGCVLLGEDRLFLPLQMSDY